jgi:Family of unknown function (DUF6152)
MRTQRLILLATAGLLLAAAPALAHHSFKVQYDETQTISLKGTITKIIWNNPHVLIYLDVKDNAGKVANWELELASPNGLISQGWKVDSLKPGEQISAAGFAARDGSTKANIRKVTLDSH